MMYFDVTLTQHFGTPIAINDTTTVCHAIKWKFIVSRVSIVNRARKSSIFDCCCLLQTVIYVTSLFICNLSVHEDLSFQEVTEAKYVYRKSDVRDTNLESEATNANGVRIVTRHPWWGFKLIPAHYQSQLDFVPESETGEISKVPYFWAGWVES